MVPHHRQAYGNWLKCLASWALGIKSGHFASCSPSLNGPSAAGKVPSLLPSCHQGGVSVWEPAFSWGRSWGYCVCRRVWRHKAELCLVGVRRRHCGRWNTVFPPAHSSGKLLSSLPPASLLEAGLAMWHQVHSSKIASGRLCVSWTIVSWSPASQY